MCKEISEAQERIQRVTEQKPIGFRGPGFSWSQDLLEVLYENGYLYDASTLPTYVGPLARAYYFWNSELTSEEKEQRKLLFGSLSEGFRPVKPYCWQLSNGSQLLELPVTTFPIIKFPFHLSYLLYVSRFSTMIMLFYLKAAIHMCRLTNTEPSFLLHPLDLLDRDQVPELEFFPGMDIDARKKIAIFERVFKELAKYFTLTNMSVHAKSILEHKEIKIIQTSTALKI
jgi:hypothetical protein